MKKFEDLSFTDDFMFCKVLELNPDICRRLVEMITGRKISRILQTQAQKVIQITDNNRGVRLDVVFEDEETVYDVEMQNYHEAAPLRRARYYQSMVDLSALERGALFTDLKDSYIIFLSTEDFFGAGQSIYRFSCTCPDLPAEVNDGTHKIFVNTAGTASDLPAELKQFFAYLKGQAPQDGFTRQIAKAVREIKRTGILRRQYMTIAEKIEREVAIAREEAIAEGLAEGLAEGREKGLAEGRERGLAEGRERGLAEGREKGRIAEQKRLVAGMLQAGIPAAQVAAIVGVSEQDLLTL